MRYGMLDNFRGGAAVDGGLECTKDEAAVISKAMLASGGQETWAGKEFQIKIDNRVIDTVRTRLDVFLQEDRRTRGKWYFNVAANPNSVFKGHNKYGLLENTVEQVQKLFSLALRYLQQRGRVNLHSLLERVKQGEVFVHSIAFAVYTKPLRGQASKLEALINAWYFLFESRVRFGNEYVSLLQALGLARGDKEQYKTSFPVRVFSPIRPGKTKPSSGHQLMHLSAYMKNQELYDKKTPFSAIEARDLGSRARLDLTVSRYFFCSYWGIKRVTLKELERVVQKRFGTWSKAVENLMQHALDRTCLAYAMSPPNPFDEKWVRQRARWEEEWQRGGSFSPPTEQWAKHIGLNLKVSPRAHLIMHSGLRGLADNTEGNIRMWLESDQKADEYTQRLTQVMREMREKSGMLTAASNLMQLDFSTVYTGVRA